MKIIKKFYPLILTTLFSSSIFFFYKNDFKEIDFFDKFTFDIISAIIFLCFLYLITEALVLRNIVIFFKKNITLVESLALMTSTYLLNSFVQLSGLGFRVTYLKEKKSINIKSFLFLSISSIFCELFIFSFFGLATTFLIDLMIGVTLISKDIKLIFAFIAVSSFIYLFLLIYFIENLKLLTKNFNLKLVDKLIEFLFFIKEKNLLLFHLKQLTIFSIQYIVVAILFVIILKFFSNENYFYNSLLTASLVDLSFIINLTPFSLGISETFAYFGTRGTSLKIIEIIIAINSFRIGIILVSLIISPMYFLISNFIKK